MALERRKSRLFAVRIGRTATSRLEWKQQLLQVAENEKPNKLTYSSSFISPNVIFARQSDGQQLVVVVLCTFVAISATFAAAHPVASQAKKDSQSVSHSQSEQSSREADNLEASRNFPQSLLTRLRSDT